MPLSNKDLSSIAKEISTTKSGQADSKSAIPNIEKQITEKQAAADRTWILYRNINDERINPYQTERRWLDGTQYVTITEQQIQDAGSRITGNLFFPSGWTENNAKLIASGNGQTTTTATNSESSVLNATVQNNGLISQITLLTSGQSSAIPTHNLQDPYIPGDPTIKLDVGSQTVGKYLYISGSGTSALVLVTDTNGTTITITEIIAPANTIAVNGNVVENIPGFSLSDRQNLTSITYQRILTELTNRITTAAGLWKTALDSQLAQLNLNIDQPSQIASAKTSVNTAITAYNTWFALSTTGVNGRFVDTSLTNLATAYNSRNSGISSRVSQITTALGSVTQNSKGDYSGSGQFLQRYKHLNFLINSGNGPLYEITGLNAAKGFFQSKVEVSADKLSTYNNSVRYCAFAEDSQETPSIKVDKAVSFSVSDTVLVTGNDLPGLQATITAISGNTITLDKSIPKEYTKDAKSGIIKAI